MSPLGDVEGSPPPRYSESTAHRDKRVSDSSNLGHGPWLVRRTSIHVESTSAAQLGDCSSQPTSISTSKHEPKRPLRNLFAKGANTQPEGYNESAGTTMQPFDSMQLGTQVTIEATRPSRSQAERRIELKGLQEAASAKRWTGNGKPGEAWGKLMKDPELWDPSGDTYVYFGYQRPNPSFRVNSSMLEETKSDDLLNKLRDGYRKDARRPVSPAQSASSSSLSGGIKGLGLVSRSRQVGPNHSDEAPVCHEIYFPAPADASRIDILRHHITTRNLFALLMNRPLVGLTYYQALVDLQERCESVMPGFNSAQLLIRGLIRNRTHNVSNDPAAAAGLLAWSEDNFWQEGWREGFVHCSGMFSRLRNMPEVRDISHISRTLLERSALELQVKIQESEDRLATFQFDDMWPVRSDQQVSVPASFNSFRRFLLRHYEKTYKTWPPRSLHEVGAWLTPGLVTRLQEDFGSLYNLYVDQDVVWDEADKYMIRKTDRAPVRAQNSNDLGLERIFTAFDQKHKYHHIPHPHPLLPQPVQITEAGKQSQSKILFSSKIKSLERRNLVASTEASNAILLGPEVTSNNLVESFLKFDKSDKVGEENIRNIRRARWVLLYGILQLLSNIANDTPHLWFKDNVDYFLNPRLKGMPPWKSSDNIFDEATAGRMYDWLTPRSS